MGLQGARVLHEGAGRCEHGKCCPLSFLLPSRGGGDVFIYSSNIYYLIYPVVALCAKRFLKAPAPMHVAGAEAPYSLLSEYVVLNWTIPVREARVKTMLSLSYPEEFVIFRVVSFPTFPIKSRHGSMLWLFCGKIMLVTL